MIESYRDLRVWNLSMQLVEATYRVTGTFPQRETFGLAAQMQRAAVSVPSNIAEAHSRAYTREYVHHIAVASGSLAELQTQIELALRLGFVDPNEGAGLRDAANSLGRQLSALRASLTRRLASSQLPTPNTSSQLPAPSSHRVP